MSDAEPQPAPFSDETVRAVCRHMNEDHAEDALVMCRAFGEQPEATRARMTGLDSHGGEFAVTVDGAEVPVRLPWAQPLTERAQIRQEVVRMYTEACAKLGLPPRDEGGH